MSKISMARPQGPFGMSQPFGILRLPLTTLFSMHKAGGNIISFWGLLQICIYIIYIDVTYVAVLYIYIILYHILLIIVDTHACACMHTYIHTYIHTVCLWVCYVVFSCVFIFCRYMYRNIDVFNMFFSRTWLPSSPSRRSFRTPGRPKRSLDSHGSVGISAMIIR